MPLLTVLAEQCLAPVPGGTGRYTRELVRALAVAPAPGWRVRTLTAWHRDLRPARIDGLPGPERLPVGRRALAALWERGLPPMPRGAVVHAPTPLAPLGVRPRRGATVVTIHDAVPYTHPDTLTPRGVTWHRRMIERAGRLADVIVVPTDATRAELAENAGISERVQVIGEGVAAAFARPPAGDAVAVARHRFGLPERYLTVVGTLEPRKGLDVAVEALARLEPDVVLAIIGPTGWGGAAGSAGAGPAGSADDLHELARRSGVADRVRFLGRLPDAELAAVVSGAAVSVLASRAEGFGLPVVEAMALGIPVVHSDLPVLAEVGGGAGLAVPVGDPAALADAVGRVLADPGLAADLTDRGRRAAARHDWRTVADQLWQLYTDLTR